MDNIKVVIVDDEKLVVDGLKIILETYEDIKVVGTAKNGEEALRVCRQSSPDVVLMDIRMPKCDGVLGTKLIKKEFKDIKILILTTFNDVKYIHEALKYGASGYILKDSDYELIYEGIKAAFKGNVVINPEVASKILSENGEYNKEQALEEVKTKYDLSDKEINIVREIASGLSNKEIAEKLFLSEGTIKNNISIIFSKLNLRDRTQVTIFAFKNNIVT
ncbi:DNA-binding NarL/FixJ family response regulator [Clostridium acetobutylicum]|uniref:Stage 0 sporulation protein A homolog n=1 Tax=Clostridium acetobutylicum (strain ATCC 824 / DSM 792 / JCM 1419 / IAM 19013 / LMG 5710 / NBRC 13948 / NRRL B-527 / VKM B-1787 / 2291 / W) TaxID=272562 RepID=Q97KQ2_CLOAB|nr:MULTISPECIES: response regulator transcription factor [Clostridium]AAK78841.1 Two-component response regulator [Clostridium acetobutylicum ATCC 824]ADZ19916.1 Two-component response regulator [Clostridium acetobutylicum EA 2018]AEI34302.1 two-component response regulator [Clostridium acetobutylicum DSM 1731]AWV80560.1 DNA-binding response regulator [Clostridium acetobutylicum]MBC2392750.1 response regulator transcription factor [Clostridium acetobutylicum]